MNITKNVFNGGIPGGVFKPLSEDALTRIHNASMKVFETTGIQVNDDKAMALFKSAGADVDFNKRIVRADGNWVMDKIKTAPSKVILYGREPKHDLNLDGFNVYFGTGGTALNIIERDGNRTPTSLREVEKSARLVDALENIHYYILSCYPNDIPKDRVDVNRFYAGIRNTTKHVMGGVYTHEGIKNLTKIGAMIAGSREEFLRKPFFSVITCIMSPLVMDKHYTSLMITAVEEGLPIATPTAPMAGSTSPATLSGTLVQMNVEALSGVILTQLVNPGHPVLYSCVPTTMDLRTGTFCFGSVEMGLMNAACAQLSRFYKLPNYTTAGVNDAKISDVQSGYEAMSSILMCALAGSNFIHDAAGLIESGLSISYEKYVIDNDIIGMAMRAVKGIDVSDCKLALDVIQEVAPAGNYLGHEHTIMNMREEFYYPLSTDRMNRANWEIAGSRDGRYIAGELAEEILNEHKPLPIRDEVHSRILTEIPGMVQEWL